MASEGDPGYAGSSEECFFVIELVDESFGVPGHRQKLLLADRRAPRPWIDESVAWRLTAAAFGKNACVKNDIGQNGAGSRRNADRSTTIDRPQRRLRLFREIFYFAN